MIKISDHSTDQRAICMCIDGQPACLVMADRFLLLSEVKHAYCNYTGFSLSSVSAYHFGPNILMAMPASEASCEDS